MGDTAHRYLPQAGYVFRICTPVLASPLQDGTALTKHKGVFTFYCTALLPLADTIQAENVFVADVKQSDRFHFLVVYRRPQGSVQFRSDTKDLEVSQFPHAPWMSLDEKQAEAELKEMADSPYAVETSDFFLKLQENFRRSVLGQG